MSEPIKTISQGQAETFSGVCRCCLTVGFCKSLLLPVVSSGRDEIYLQTLENCLGLKIPIEESSYQSELYLICENCISKLMYCVEFKRQVVDSMRLFKEMIKIEPSVDEALLYTEGDGKLSPTTDTWVSMPSQFKNHKRRKKSRKRTKVMVGTISGKDKAMDTVDFQHTNIEMDYDDDNLTDVEQMQNVVQDAVEPTVTVKRTYNKKKPSGAQRAREIQTMMDQEKLQCKICLQVFPNNYGLKVHMHEHFPDYKCDVCGKGFAIKKQCQYHKRRHQTGEFTCPQCGKTLPSRAKYDHHMFSHRTRHSYVCRYCKERFKSHYAREKHLRDVHESEKKYKCDQCPEMFLVKGTLDIHYRRIHVKRENKYVCDLCSKSFFDRTALKKHMIVHNGKRIHQCAVCLKSYPRIRTLHEHMKIHNNVRNHMCNMCGKAFVQACTLRGHLKVHEKEKMREVANAQNNKDYLKMESPL